MKSTALCIRPASAIFALTVLSLIALTLPAHAGDKAKPASGESRNHPLTGFDLRDGDSCGCFEFSGGLVSDDVATATSRKVPAQALVSKTEAKGFVKVLAK